MGQACVCHSAELLQRPTLHIKYTPVAALIGDFVAAGGIRNSGFGRELGTFGLENFLSVKQAGPRDWFWASSVPGHTMCGAELGWIERGGVLKQRTLPPGPLQITTYTSQEKWGWFPERSPSPRL